MNETQHDYSSREESLSALFASLIAAQDKIDPSEVTLEYILKQRKKLYLEKRFDHGSRFGGYDDIGLHVFTGNELLIIDEIAQAFLEEF